MSLVSHSDYSDVFMEEYPNMSTIPLYMRHTVLVCCAAVETGLFNGYFPRA
jgi:hypothetical protein